MKFIAGKGMRLGRGYLNLARGREWTDASVRCDASLFATSSPTPGSDLEKEGSE